MLTSVVPSSGLWHCIDSSHDLQNKNESVWQNFTIDCSSANTYSSQCDCLTLNEIAMISSDNISRLNIMIKKDQQIGKVDFEYKEELIISGESGTIISCVGGNSGLAFREIDRLTITNVTVTNCSTTNSSESIYYYAVCMVWCGDIIFTSVNIIGNNATGVSILEHQGGTINFTN